MNLTEEASLSSEPDTHPRALPGPTAETSSSATDVRPKQQAQSSPLPAQIHSSLGQHGPAAARFIIRSAKDRSQNPSPNDKNRELTRLRSVFEKDTIGTEPGKRYQNQAPSQEVLPESPTCQVKTSINSDKPDHPRDRTESWTNKPKTDNLIKFTAESKLPHRQMIRNDDISKGKQEPDNSTSRSLMSVEPAGARVNMPGRSKSLGWRGVSHPGQGGRTGIQTFWEGRVGRPTENLERVAISKSATASTSNNVLSGLNVYNLAEKTEQKKNLGLSLEGTRGQGALTGQTRHLGLALEKASSGQSLPSRIKLRCSQSVSGEESYPSLEEFRSGPKFREPAPGTRKDEKACVSKWTAPGCTQDWPVRAFQDAKLRKSRSLPTNDVFSCGSSSPLQTNLSGVRSQEVATFPELSRERSHGKLTGGQTSFTEIRGLNGLEHRSVNNNDHPFSVQSLRVKRGNSSPSAVKSIFESISGPSQLTKNTAHGGGEMRERECVKEKGGDEELWRDQNQEMLAEEGKKREKLRTNEELWNAHRGITQLEPLKAATVREKSPTVRFCKTVDLTQRTSTKLQDAISALGGMKKQSKQDTSDHPDGKPETIRAIAQSPEMSNIGGDENQDDACQVNGTPGGTVQEKTGVDFSSNSVRSKINRFESLAQKSQTFLLQRTRALSVPGPSQNIDWPKKNGSERTLGGVSGNEAGNLNTKGELKRGEGESIWGRSVSMEENCQRRDSRGRGVWGNWTGFCNQPKKCGNREAFTSNSTANVERQKYCQALSDEPDSSKVTEVSEDRVSDDLELKCPAANQQPNYNNNNGNYGVNDTTYTSDKDSPDLNANLISYKDKILNSPQKLCPVARSPSYGNNDSTNPGSASMREPHGSVITLNTMGPALSGNQFQSSIDRTSSTQPAPKLDLSHFVLQPHSRTTLLEQNEDQTPFSVSVARWSSEEEWLTDEEEEDDDDDDDDDTEKDEDSNYDSDSAESSVTITSNTSQSDRRSFSMSLAGLCNFGGVDYRRHDDGFCGVDSEDSMSHRTASLSSDISALSCVSILATDELDRLLDDVRGLGDETLQNYEDVQVVVLHKEVGCGLGFTVAGGVDQNKPITVHRVFPCGLAAQEGSIRVGDQVLSINGTALQNSAHWEAMRTLRRARSQSMAVVVLQTGGTPKEQQARTGRIQGFLDQSTATTGGKILRVVLNKYRTDLGFSLEGGLDSSQGDRPILIKKLFLAGPMDDVVPGDELLEIKGQSVQGLRRLEVWNLIRKLPPGPVDVVLKRPFKI